MSHRNLIAVEWLHVPLTRDHKGDIHEAYSSNLPLHRRFSGMPQDQPGLLRYQLQVEVGYTKRAAVPSTAARFMIRPERMNVAFIAGPVRLDELPVSLCELSPFWDSILRAAGAPRRKTTL